MSWRKNKSNKQQKTLLWTVIIISLAITIIVTITTPPSQYATISCQSNNQCYNTLYACNPNNTFQSHHCNEKMLRVCNQNPELCNNEYIPPNTTIGEEAPITIKLLPSIVATLLTIGGIGYYLLRNKDEE